MRKLIYIFLLIQSLSFGQRMGFPAPLCTEYKTLVASCGTYPTVTDVYPGNELIQLLKRDTLWTGLDLLQIYAQSVTGNAVLNWKLPGTYTATLVNSPTFTTYAGYAGNGTTSYENSGFNNATNGVNFTRNAGSYGVYSLLATTSTGDACGAVSVAGSRSDIISQFTDNKVYYRTNSSAADASGNVATTGTSGLIMSQINSSVQNEVFKKGSSLGTKVMASAAITSLIDYVSCRNLDGTAGSFSTEGIAMFIVAGKLTAYNHSRLSIDLNRYMMRLGTNVY